MKLIMNIAQFYRRFHSRFRLLSVLFVLFSSLGMSSVPKNAPAASSNEQIRTQVDQTLASFKSTYESENLPDFMYLLDKDFENRLTFQSNLENYFISHKNLELMTIIDVVLVNKNKISVRLHWFKKSSTNDEIFSKSQGSSQFVFIKAAPGLKLLYLRGDNPFY